MKRSLAFALMFVSLSALCLSFTTLTGCETAVVSDETDDGSNSGGDPANIPGIPDGFDCVNLNDCQFIPGMNECESGVLCSSHGQCEDLELGFRCNCDEGFESQNLFECVNINECDAAEDPCGANGTCSDLDGSYECSCDSGFEFDGVTCVPTP